MRDLAPEIHRQRLVIEGYPNEALSAREISDYLLGLSQALDMVTIADPVTHRSEKFGEAAWIHWETSGAHFYSWETPRLFFSVDIYTCKAFALEAALSYTRGVFAVEHLEHKAW